MNHIKRYILPTTYFLLLFLSITAHAQAPEGFNYSAIVRDNLGNPLSNQAVSFRFSIIRGNVTGTVVYSETHNTITDPLGQVSLIIGNGLVVSGVFANIDWGGDAYFLKVELDKTGGNSYVEMGISQFLSVPYALYAKKAGSGGGGTGDINITAGNNITITGAGTDTNPYRINEKHHYVGEYYGGGVVFFTYDEGRHGLIADTIDQDLGIQWYNAKEKYTNTAGDGVGSGELNTVSIVASQTSDDEVGNFAAKVCADYSKTVEGVTYGDWYLPSKYELGLLFYNNDLVGGFQQTNYWSSTELSSITAWCQNFKTGQQVNLNKGLPFAVRAIRAF